MAKMNKEDFYALASRVVELENRAYQQKGKNEDFLRCIRDTREALLSNKIETCTICGVIGARHDMVHVKGILNDNAEFAHSTCREGTEFDRRKVTRGEEKT